jgi:hypothetical protein
MGLPMFAIASLPEPGKHTQSGNRLCFYGTCSTSWTWFESHFVEMTIPRQVLITHSFVFFRTIEVDSGRHGSGPQKVYPDPCLDITMPWHPKESHSIGNREILQ